MGSWELSCAAESRRQACDAHLRRGELHERRSHRKETTVSLLPRIESIFARFSSCNFKCEHCQNYDISFAKAGELGTTEVLPERSVQLALERNCSGIAWTYNEPTIWFEYTYDSAILAKEAGLYTVYVTNGYMTAQALETIGPYLDAANVDVKGFSKKFYNGVCRARLDPVLKTCERMHESGIHLELTYLIIPGLNDDDEQLSAFSLSLI